jgi:hypothetical protein
MTTFESTPTLTQYFAMRMASNRSKRVARSRATRQSWALNVLRLLLHLAGFSCLTFAGFEFNMLAGLITAGLSCFVFSRLIAPEPSESTTTDPMLRR